MNPTHVSMRAHAWQPKGSRFQRFCDPWGNGRAGPSLMCVSTELSRRLPCWLCQHGRHGFDPGIVKTPWRRKWQLEPVFLPGKSQGQRRLEGYSP